MQGFSLYKTMEIALLIVGTALLVLMQQHNMKEEQIFYPLCERLLGAEQEDLIERMRRLQHASVASTA